jgi:orotate phosphoribosyltransferase-like protein
MTTGDEYEAALRSLPEAYSLALRLQDAGVTDEVICEYLRIERESLSTLLEMARRKLNSAIDNTDA